MWCALALPACSGSDGVEAAEGRSDAGSAVAPFPIDTTSAAAAGADLVALKYTYHQPDESGGIVTESGIPAVVLTADGRWHDLPAVPFRGIARAASAGDAVIAGGFACTDDACERGTPAFARLREDRSGWDRLDAPTADLIVEETETGAISGMSPVAVFSIGGTSYVVTEDGTVSAKPSPWIPEGDRQVGCILDGAWVRFGTQGLPLMTGGGLGFLAVGDLYVQQLDPPEFPDVDAGPVPAEMRAGLGLICGAGLVSVPFGSEQYTYSLDTTQWERSPSNVGEVAGDPMFGTGPGTIATAPDHRTVYAVAGDTMMGDARIITREGTGPWADAGEVGTSVVATSEHVWAIAADGTAVDLWKA